ncbi:MAG: hypothetical protein KGL48_08490 [Sphingomonadales bacterium]|nr:hypothetical protein [Sphingomonadales bacterium]MDE2570599.1 hypothetical protein [Sphingomonadales bacterium]
MAEANQPNDTRPWPQEGRERMIYPSPVGWKGSDWVDNEEELLRRLNPKTVFMMGDNPALPRMPERPKLLDFFRCRFGDITVRHLLVSARRAMDDGLDEKVVTACLLHDLSNGCLIRADHGYWSAQLIAPYVDEEVAFAVKYHQALRYVPDESVGYAYPESYKAFFGPDYQPPAYLLKDAEYAKSHHWYMTARTMTLYDTYFFDDFPEVDPEEMTDLIGRNFREPEEGLGFDGSDVAHMWRTMIWPNNFL